MKTIFVTGPDGFIGSHLMRYLSGGFNLIAPVISELDLTDEKQVDVVFAQNQIDGIIHLAAAGVRTDANATMDEVAQPNLKMFQNLAKHVSAACPMIILGSGAEYDKSRDIKKIKEEEFGVFIPKDPYGYSKYLISKEIEKRKNILNLRVFGVYGIGENSTRVTTSVIKDNLNHQAMRLNQNVRFSFIYIDDLCRIICEFIQKMPKEKFINVCSLEDISIEEIAKTVNSVSENKSDIIFQKEGMNKEYTADTSLLMNLLPGFTFTSYIDGLTFLYQGLKNDQ